MTSIADPKLLQPFDAGEDVVRRDEAVKDRNNASPPDEDVWLATARQQHAEISSVEVAFFKELHQREGR